MPESKIILPPTSQHKTGWFHFPCRPHQIQAETIAGQVQTDVIMPWMIPDFAYNNWRKLMELWK